MMTKNIIFTLTFLFVGQFCKGQTNDFTCVKIQDAPRDCENPATKKDSIYCAALNLIAIELLLDSTFQRCPDSLKATFLKRLQTTSIADLIKKRKEEAKLTIGQEKRLSEDDKSFLYFDLLYWLLDLDRKHIEVLLLHEKYKAAKRKNK
jgi:hypothetical protein